MVFGQAAQPRTIIVNGEGTQTLSYTLPEGVALKLESVLATIDGGAGTPTPSVTITAPGGAVIAAKRQTSSVDAGAGNRATWALRLADDGAVQGTFGARLSRSTFNQSIPPLTPTNLIFDTIVWDTGGLVVGGGPWTRFTLPTDGLYLGVASAQISVPGGATLEVRFQWVGATPVSIAETVAYAVKQSLGVESIPQVSGLFHGLAGDEMRVSIEHDSGGNRNVFGIATLHRLGDGGF